MQAELRELNRGMKALPISRMKKHELEHAIDSMRKLKIEKAATPMPPPAKAGRPLSRPIASESIEDDGLVLDIPLAPRPRQVENRTPKKVAPKLKVDGSDLFPAVTNATKAPVGKARMVAPKLDVDDMEKKVKKHAHTCNCDNCPHGGSLVHFA